MHSRIFQLTEEPFEHPDDMTVFDWESLEDLPHGIDYLVEPESPREEDIEWLFGLLGKYKGITFNDESFVLDDEFKTNYFQPKLDFIKKKMSKLSLEDFIDEDFSSLEVFEIERAIEDPYAFRVYTYD